MNEIVYRDEVLRQHAALCREDFPIETGWIEMCVTAMPDRVNQRQFDEMRMLFFYGTLYLFNQLSAMSKTDAETPANQAKLNAIHRELSEFAAYKLLDTPAGSA